jgi:peptide/nickel transport system substrate-binding protein
LTLLLFIAVACGGTAATPVIVEKEVVKEVIKEVVVTATPGPTAAPEVLPQYGGFINMMDYADVRQRLIHQSSILNKNLSPLFNKLVEYNPETDNQSDIRCDLCTSWDLADDGVTYTFHLANNAKWWDGVPVTADDVVFMFESIAAPDQFEILEGRSTSSSILTGLYYEAGNAQALDTNTVEVVIKFPSGSFLASLAVETVLVQPKHTVIDQGILQGGRNMDALNRSGPFKFVEHINDVSTEYAKNPEYFKEGRPYIDGMKHFVIVDSGRVIAAFKTGQVLTSNWGVTNMSALEAQRLDDEMDNLTVHWGGPATSLSVNMNTAKPPFDDPKVRTAVHLALYRQPIIETFTGGKNLMGSLNPPGFWYSRTLSESEQLPGYRELNGEKHPDDIAEAQRLLKEAGISENLKVTLTARNCCVYPDEAVLIKEQLKKNRGWDIEIEVLEAGAGFDAYWAGDYQFMIQASTLNNTSLDAVHASWVLGTLPQWVGGGRGKFFTVEGVDELFEQQMREPNQEKRKALVNQIEDTLYNGASASAVIWWTMRHQPVDYRIQNYHFTDNGMAWEHVWCNPAC